jgi:glucose/mannose transport system permease protein
MIATALVVFLGGSGWTVVYSFTNSKLLPKAKFVGLDQYDRLWSNRRWLISIENLLFYGLMSLVFTVVMGFILAVLMDQKIRFEDTFRTIMLYPFALSFIVTGLVWQWILNPELGLQTTVRGWGFENFSFDWIVSQDKVIYTIVIAAVWQASGLVMALMLAGLRGIDEEMWKAARIDGIPRWRVYASIVLPQLGPSFATALVLLSVGVVKVYDAVIAMTQGGPGIASEVPAKFIMDYLFGRANIGLASAASTVMLLTVLAVITPWLYARSRANRNAREA